MSKIILNAENVSKFNKRLQKALIEHFGQDVKLNEAAKLFARAIGKENEYELKKALLSSNEKEKTFDQKMEELKLFNKSLNIQTLDLLCLRIQELLKTTTAEFVFIDFYEDHYGISSGLFTIGFESFDICNSLGLLEVCMDDSNLGFNDYLKDSIFNFIDKKDSNQMKTYIEANKAENQKGINDLLGFKETYIYKIISLISDCDDSILIERDKITLNLRKNSRVIDSNNLKM